MNTVVRLPAPEKRTAAELVNYESEQALLGAILIDNAVMTSVSGWLKAEHFADALHGRIFEACRTLIDQGTKADRVTLRRLFDADEALAGIGGRYLVDLAGAAITTEFADDYGHVILDLWRKRRLVAMADDLREAAFDPARDADDIAAEVTGSLHALVEARRTGGGNARELAIEVVEMAQRPSRAVSTGLASLDAAMAGGLWPGRAYALRGQTKAGKSALSGTIAWNLNLAGVACLYLAFEMTPHQLARRNLARQMGVNGLQLLPGARAELLSRAGTAAMDTPAHALYEPMAGRTLDDAVRLIREHVVAHKIHGVFVDYMQLVRGAAKGEGPAQFFERVAYDLIALAGRLDIWVVFLSQLNREGQTRWGDGLNFAVDQMFTLFRGVEAQEAALVMDLTRDTPYRNVGVVDDKGQVTKAGLIFHKSGPHFSDAGSDPQEQVH